MSEESKTTYLFGDSRGSSVDPNVLLAMNGGGMGGNGMWNNPIWAIVFLAALRNGGIFGNDGNCGYGNCNTAFVSSQLGQAIAGNANAISNLATHLDCSVGQVQNALNTISSQMSNCCCDIRESITKQGYENQIATINQTNVLGGKIDAQTTFLSDKFCDLEKREMQNKIDSLREANSTLKGQIDNANQTAQITSYINQLVTPIAQEVAGIKCRLPETVNVPYSPVVGIPTCTAATLGLGLGFGGGLGINGSQWA